ncbi:MAG TPA: hypothetical protein VJB18_07740 [Burkholderiales bacterium]|nr:hypothetical protein [Burkholderiales bacterium]
MHDLTYDNRVQLARLIVTLLDSWEVPAENQISLLGLPPETSTLILRRFYENEPLPDEVTINERVDHLLGIADALRTSYPHNAHMGAIWMNRRNNRFDNRTPLAVLLEDGLQGFLAIRTHLDCAYDWDISGSKV